MLKLTFFFAPILAALSAITISTQLDVHINHIYVPVVVFGTGGYEMQNDSVTGSPLDVTSEQIQAAKERLIAAGIAPERMQTWTQTLKAKSTNRDGAPVHVGIIMIDLGAPAEARRIALLLPPLRSRNVQFAWNQYVGVDCTAMESRTTSLLQIRAREAATGGHATMRTLWMTSDPRTQTFDPIPYCPVGKHPVVHSAGGVPPLLIRESFRRYASASIELAYTSIRAISTPPPATTVFYPFSTFGFPSPIIGHQNRAYVLHGGRFAAMPGASSISTPIDGMLVRYSYQNDAKYALAARILEHAGIPSSDYFEDVVDKLLFIRMHPVTQKKWASLPALSADSLEIYRLLKNCEPYQTYAHELARVRSRRLAQAAARVLRVGLGPLMVESDWAGPSSDATCGTDGAGDLRALVAFAKRAGRLSYSDQPYYANFEDSLYAAWTLGTHAPTIASESMVERLVQVLRSDKPGQRITGTATLTPDAYFYRGRHANGFTTAVVAAKTDVPQGISPGNVITNCDAASERALANAIKVAQFDHPVVSLYATPARFLSIACLPKDVIGRSFSSLPTVYNEISPTGAAQVTQTITVYP